MSVTWYLRSLTCCSQRTPAVTLYPMSSSAVLPGRGEEGEGERSLMSKDDNEIAALSSANSPVKQRTEQPHLLSLPVLTLLLLGREPHNKSDSYTHTPDPWEGKSSGSIQRGFSCRTQLFDWSCHAWSFCMIRTEVQCTCWFCIWHLAFVVPFFGTKYLVSVDLASWRTRLELRR